MNASWLVWGGRWKGRRRPPGPQAGGASRLLPGTPGRRLVGVRPAHFSAYLVVIGCTGQGFGGPRSSFPSGIRYHADPAPPW